ncbi:hypothetical protein V8G54_019085 [Vigna mungo]|uniref:DNA2/NAM7 helicase-like C-terminal domain-containing protein n=1 Tax=Vigna mungo TaxID=3915 RepID=A0AAQ3RS30_VIGMU
MGNLGKLKRFIIIIIMLRFVATFLKVGDPAQLPATVISDIAKNHGLMKAGYPVKMLKTQYRMHPEVGAYCLELSKRLRIWLNIEEVDFVLFLYQKLISLYPALKSGNKVAIISPYSQQVKLFQKRFEEIFGMSAEKVVDICTVDGCQGREKDIAIFSCDRASKDDSIGFLEDRRLMNVGITRAKSAVLVVGSASTLRRSKQWNKLVESAEKRDCLSNDDSLASMQKKLAEPSQLIGPTDTVDNDVQPNTAATFDDQAQAEDNDDGDVDMNDAGFDED